MWIPDKAISNEATLQLRGSAGTVLAKEYE